MTVHHMKPRVGPVYECSHMRQVVLVDNQWRHILPEGTAAPVPCIAGVYRSTATVVGDHTISDYVSANPTDRQP